MLDFFKKAAKVYLNVFFWVFIIVEFLIGLVILPWGLLLTVFLWLVTVFFFSLIGSFIGLVDDVAAIRKSIANGEKISVSDIDSGSNSKSDNTSIKERYWDCQRCGTTNIISNIYCQNCGNPKSANTPVQPTVDYIDKQSRFWTCPDCGCYNPLSESKCTGCGSPKP